MHNYGISQDNYSIENDISDTTVTESFANMDNIVTTNGENYDTTGATSKVTYADLTNATSGLIRYIVNDQKKSRMVLSTILKWTESMKQNINYDIRFERGVSRFVRRTNYNMENTNATRLNTDRGNNSNPKVNDMANIKRSIARVSNASGNAVRKKSRLEINARKKRKRDIELKRVQRGANNKNNDISILGQPKIRNYGCCICHQSGHQYKFCPEIVDHGTPLDLKNKEARIQLCQKLNSTNRLIKNRRENDQRTVMTTTPKQVIGVIIHNSFWIKNMCNQEKDVGNISLECTFLQDFGKKIYCRTLFQLSCIAGYIPRNQSNIVICNI